MAQAWDEVLRFNLASQNSVDAISELVQKPLTGWLHSDQVMVLKGAVYNVMYVGNIEVKTSMKTVNFKTRSQIAKECITRVCEMARGRKVERKRRVDRKIAKCLGTSCDLTHGGTEVQLNISSINMSLRSVGDEKLLVNHDMPHISFASGGDGDTANFVGYIAKDYKGFRACYVIECESGIARDVIATMGQAFELRFQQFVRPRSHSHSTCTPRSAETCWWGAQIDKDYYNDLPGKVPPDVGPPPVPPLPASIPPFNTLPSIHSPNLIDFHSDSSSTSTLKPDNTTTNTMQHNYVNDGVNASRDSDMFDMQPFTGTSATTSANMCREITLEQRLEELRNEPWFHGQISRAEAENILQADGDFLVRKTSNSEGQFVLSGVQNNTKKHLLLIDPEGVVRTKDRVFNSVSHLIYYHQGNALPIMSSESALVLRNAIHHK